MYQVGDTIQYSSTGICKIDAIEEKVLGKIKKSYYVLMPISHSNSTVYVPVDNEALTSKMRRILNKDEILEIIHSSSESPDILIENDTERREKFTDIIHSGNRKDLLILIRSLYLHKEHQQSNGRKFHIADERVFKEAERILYDELSYTLEIPADEVVKFIQENI